jgi:hypothetical protein
MFKVKYKDGDKEDYSIYKINGMFKFVDEEESSELTECAESPEVQTVQTVQVYETVQTVQVDETVQTVQVDETAQTVAMTVETSSSIIPVVKQKVVFDLTDMSEIVVENADSICSQICDHFDLLSVTDNGQNPSYSKFINKETGKKMKMIFKFVEDVDDNDDVEA